MEKIQTFADATAFLQHLHSTCFWKLQTTAFEQLKQNIEDGFEASLEVFHNNYKNPNLRSAVFKCTHCEDAVAFVWCPDRMASDKAAYKANIISLFEFFNVTPDKEPFCPDTESDVSSSDSC